MKRKHRGNRRLFLLTTLPLSAVLCWSGCTEPERTEGKADRGDGEKPLPAKTIKAEKRTEKTPVSDPDRDEIASAAEVPEEDPAKALEKLLDLPKGAERTRAVMVAFSHLAKSDPEKAVSILMDMELNEDPYTLQTAAIAVAAAASETRPEDAAKLASLLPAGVKRHKLLETMAAQVANGGVEQVETWARALPDADMRDAGLFGAALALAQQDMEAVENWVQTLPAGSMRVAAKAGMAVKISESDPEQAKRIVINLPPGVGRDRGIASVVERLVYVDVDATAEWIGQLPADRSRDLAYEECIYTCFQLNREYRTDLADMIADQTIRQSLERGLAKELLRTGRSRETAEWIKQSSLPESEKSALLEEAGP